MHLHGHVHIPNQNLQIITPTCWLQLQAWQSESGTSIPDFPFEWSDTKPQRSHQSLTIDDFLPSSEDAMKLQQNAAQYLMSFLVENFTDLADLQSYVPPMEPIHPPEKSEVVPMKILFKDEKLKSDTIDILTQLMMDANLDGTPQVHIHVGSYLPTLLNWNNARINNIFTSHTCAHTHMYTHTCTHKRMYTKGSSWRPVNV